MISPGADACLVAALLAAALESWFLPRTRRKATGEFTGLFPTLAVALLLSWLVFAAIGPSYYGVFEGRGRLPLLCGTVGGVLVLLAGMRSEQSSPSSVRHFAAVIVGGCLLVVGELGIPYLTLPFLGSFALPAILSILVTLAWVFIVASLFEVLGLIPLLTGLAAIVAGSFVLLPFEVFHSFPGLVFSGSLMGAVLGRFAGQLAVAQSRHSGTAEVLVLGYAAAATTLTVFAKSIVIASFIMPVGILVILLVLAVMQSLGSGLILRRTPR